MKRDMDLIRKILFEIEKHPFQLGWVDIEIEGYTPKEISYHIMILEQAGLIEAKECSTHSGPDWKAKWLTWSGHEFLDASRDEGRWNQVKKDVLEKGGSITFDVLKALLVQIMKSSILG